MLSIRPAVVVDQGFFYQLAQDPHARAMFFQPEPPTWAEHLAWWALDYHRFVGHLHGIPVGVIWFARDDGETTVSVNIASEYRGRGFGPHLIRLGTERMVGPISAYIKRDNTASVRAFEAAGYRFVEDCTIEGGHPALRYAWPS